MYSYNDRVVPKTAGRSPRTSACSSSARTPTSTCCRRREDRQNAAGRRRHVAATRSRRRRRPRRRRRQPAGGAHRVTPPLTATTATPTATPRRRAPALDRIQRPRCSPAPSGSSLLLVGLLVHAASSSSARTSTRTCSGSALPLGLLALLMLQHLTGGTWGLAIRRLLEAATRLIPLMALLFVPIAARHAAPLRLDARRPGDIDAACTRKHQHLSAQGGT